MKTNKFAAALIILSSYIALGACAPVGNNNEIDNPVISSNMDSSNFSEEIDYVSWSKSLYQLHMEFSVPISEKDKARLFLWIVSLPQFSEELKQWWNDHDETYQIPLNFIENMVYSYLDTDTFNPNIAFSDFSDLNYDTESNVLTLSEIGGYGGAAALEVIGTEQDGNKLRITLASYQMDTFYGECQEKMIMEYYITQWTKTFEQPHYRLYSCEISTESTQD